MTFPLGGHHSIETKAKMSTKRLGVPKPAEHRVRIGIANKGLKRSPAQRRRNCLTHLFKTIPPEQRAKASASLKGRIVSTETRAKLSYFQTHSNYDHGRPRISKPQRAMFEFLLDMYPDAKLEFPVSVEGHWYCLDVAIPSLMLDCEYDGSYWHRRPTVKARDVVRDDRLKSAGWVVLRIKETAELKAFMEV